MKREEWQDIWENGSEEEKQLLALTVQAIKQKRKDQQFYLSAFLGIQGSFRDEQTYQIEMPVTSFIHNPVGIVHGGILATLLDTTMGMMINKKLPADQFAVTTELKINYLLPGKGEKLRSEASILHRGKTLIVTQGNIYDEQDRLLAHGTATFMVLQKR
ncbi:PaaI family thioesterase [Brevibacillus fulvus]|uniref:Uncharacterized protein (TIGR00369 family) n=1 Tax=Brevibacillus fulvus TaxID=1125967 RepID=A0A939BPQ9_9BACL|nr:PaaI family thioesterase [Brevibacillus fulvus]MBM7590760.1 uncharacterized protein (TIGR00369 family) [Brevibacillus fulvus]